VRDRIGQIVATSIAEVPYIDAREYPLADDLSSGYIVVIVPQSPRAPHQVTVGGDLRFYGRGAMGNRRLTEGEVARLYERRESWQVSRDQVLAEVVANAPVPQEMGSGYIHAFTRPVALGQGIFERAVAALGGSREMHQWLLNTACSTKLRGGYGPSLEQAAYWYRHGADMWRLSTRDDQERSDLRNVTSLVDLAVNLDGRGHLFCGRATDTTLNDPARPLIIEMVIAGNVETFFAVMGKLYEAAGYFGHVDVGVALTGVQGTASERRSRSFRPGPLYPSGEFARTDRVAAAELHASDDVAYRLLRHFFEATTGIEGYNPWSEYQNR
jgi:hypothetical protein